MLRSVKIYISTRYIFVFTQFESSRNINHQIICFAQISLENDHDIIVDVRLAMKAPDNVLQLHQIPKASPMLPRNPKYRLDGVP